MGRKSTKECIYVYAKKKERKKVGIESYGPAFIVKTVKHREKSLSRTLIWTGLGARNPSGRALLATEEAQVWVPLFSFVACSSRIANCDELSLQLA